VRGGFWVRAAPGFRLGVSLVHFLPSSGPPCPHPKIGSGTWGVSVESWSELGVLNLLCCETWCL
ncbi:MAG: hypothetical protein ACAI35_24485, partial [Candidatus Methylacidiphilales bacterium]